VTDGQTDGQTHDDGIGTTALAQRRAVESRQHQRDGGSSDSWYRTLLPTLFTFVGYQRVETLPASLHRTVSNSPSSTGSDDLTDASIHQNNEETAADWLIRIPFAPGFLLAGHTSSSLDPPADGR